MTDPGYGFVPLPPKVRRVERAEARWDRCVPGTFSGVISLEIVAEQPIHVGSGAKRVEQGTVVLGGARICGGPGIPGASFKGVLRARYEAITLSCAGQVPGGRDRRLKVRSQSCEHIKVAQIMPAALNALAPEVLGSRCRPTSGSRAVVCPACSLFGCMSLRSRITVTDLTGIGGTGLEIRTIPERFSPNLHHIGPARVDAGETKFEVYGLRGRKFGRGRGPASEQQQRVEAIPAGTHLTGQLRLLNVAAEELGALLTALGCTPESKLKLGGGKAHGFGRVRARVGFQLKDGGQPATSVEPAVWRRSFEGSQDRWEDGETRLVALHQGDC